MFKQVLQNGWGRGIYTLSSHFHQGLDLVFGFSVSKPASKSIAEDQLNSFTYFYKPTKQCCLKQ